MERDGPSAGEGQDMFPIAVLIEELKADDTHLRLMAIRQLDHIAKALGEERTRLELVPFLTESIDDDDEVLLALTEELGKFVPLVGGHEWAYCLLQPLETLAAVEETVVREKAVQMLCTVGEQIPAEHVVEHYAEMLRRLASGDWFTSRVSSCGLFPVAYAKLDDAAAKAQLRAQFSALCHDETPMVRRAAASNLGKIAKVAEPELLLSDIVPMFTHLASDEQDSVRILAAENCSSLAALLAEDESAAHVVPIVCKFGEDASWRVRYMVAEQLCLLAEELSEAVVVASLAPIFAKMLEDPEAEVRTVAARHVASFSKHVPQGVIEEQLIGSVSSLASDASQHVKAALAQEIMGLAPQLGKDVTIERLLPLFLQLLRDESSEVRLNVISRLEVVSGVLGVDQIAHSLLPAVMELAQDQQWRVRLAVIQYMPLLAQQLGAEIFDRDLSQLCLSWLEDSVYAIREAAVKNLPRLCAVFGEEWALANVVPRVITLYKDQANYMHRLTAFYAINALIESAVAAPEEADGAPEASGLTVEVIVERLLPVVLEAAKQDAVANVQFNAAKTMGKLIPHVDASTVGTVIKPSLEELLSHADVDVQFFANEALSVC
eukprot:COSAG04_NODE_3969_length_2389_cov_2.134061_1_plen_606_part_00